jgi:hypothetical protein
MADLLFADTSIQISKVLGSEEQKTRILERLERADRVVTSNYVLMEFNRRVLLDSIHLHDLMKNIKMLAELLYRIAQDGFGRQKHNMILIFSHLLEGYSDGTLVIDTPEFWRKLVKGLEHSIDWQLYRQFLMGIDLTFPSLINVTECSIAHQLPTKRQTKEGKAEYVYKYTCRRDEARCRLPQLLQEHADELLVLEQILEKHEAKSELKKAFPALSLIREHKEGWNAAKGSRNCWRLGDVIITLEVPEGYTLLTTNARHFVPLCEALGKRCEILSLVHEV